MIRKGFVMSVGQLMNPVEAEAIPDTMQVSLEPRDRRRSIATV